MLAGPAQIHPDELGRERLERSGPQDLDDCGNAEPMAGYQGGIVRFPGHFPWILEGEVLEYCLPQLFLCAEGES